VREAHRQPQDLRHEPDRRRAAGHPEGARPRDPQEDPGDGQGMAGGAGRGQGRHHPADAAGEGRHPDQGPVPRVGRGGAGGPGRRSADGRPQGPSLLRLRRRRLQGDHRRQQRRLGPHHRPHPGDHRVVQDRLPVAGRADGAARGRHHHRDPGGHPGRPDRHLGGGGAAGRGRAFSINRRRQPALPLAGALPNVSQPADGPGDGQGRAGGRRADHPGLDRPLLLLHRADGGGGRDDRLDQDLFPGGTIQLDKKPLKRFEAV